MSVPLAPKKSYYTQLQDNRKGVKNNNESLLSLGDTNANQIMVEGGPSRDESQTCDLTDEIGNANSHEPENRSHFHNEFHSLQGFGKGLQAGPSSLKDLKLSSTVHREINEEHTMQRGTALLQPAWSGQGTSLAGWRSVTGEASPNVLTPRGTEAPRHAPKDQLAKMLDDATLRRHTLDRASSPAAAGDQFMKECARSLTQPPPQPVPLDPPDAPDGMPKGGEGPQETVTSHSPGTACPPADITSEGKSVCHPKPSTSETKETTCLEPPMEGAHVPEVSNENTPRSAHSECALTSASKEVLSKPEAQLDQEKGEPKPELKFVQPWALQEFLSARAECLGCPKEDSVLLQERNLPGREAQQEAPTRAVSSLTPPQSSVLTLGGPRGRSVQDQSAVPLGEQGSLQTFPKPGPASLRAADNQLPGKISPIAAGKLHESSSSSPSPGDGHAAFIPHAPADSRPSAASEEKRVLSSGSRASAMDFTSDPSVGESKTGVPEPLDPQSSSSEARESKEVTTSVAENKNLLENAVKTESSTAKTDSPLSVPTPLHPETTVSVTPQPSASLQDLSMSVDAGSPSGSLSAAPPPTDSLQLLNTSPKVPDKNTCPSGIPKPISTHSEGTPSSQEALESHQVERTAERTEPKPIILPKPKHVRPKIITYIRRSPQALGQVDTSLVPVGLPYAPPTCNTPLPKEEKVAGRDLKPAASLYEKFKPDLQKPRVFSPGLMVSGIKPPGHHFSQISEKFLQEVTELPGKEEFCSPPYAHYEVPPTFYRSAMLLKPQLGLGAMSRLPSAKSRILIASQRSSASAIHPPGPMATAASLYNSDPAGDLKKASSSNAAKSCLPKSGLRPPGYSRLPAAKLAALGFVRSSSVTSVSSTQSLDSAQPEQSRLANCSAFGNEEQPTLKAALPSKDAPKGAGRVAPLATSSVTTPRRSLLPAPKSTATPAGTKKELQKDQDANKPAVSSPKRAAPSTTKLHSPGYPKQRSTAPRNGFSPKPDPQAREAERQLVQRLKERSEQQARQLSLVQRELRRAICGFQALAVSTQHFFGKNESALVKEKELSIELANIRDEVAFNTARCEKLQKEKEELERRFEDEVRKLGWQQQAELQDLQGRLQLQFQAEMTRLQEEHSAQLLRIRCQHQEQVEDITASHEAALLEMENNHTVAIAILQDDHDHKVQELMSTHELEKKELEDSFEKLRLSLQDQVDTLTFQSQSLRDRARRFEEALQKNTEEQLEVSSFPGLQHRGAQRGSVDFSPGSPVASSAVTPMTGPLCESATKATAGQALPDLTHIPVSTSQTGQRGFLHLNVTPATRHTAPATVPELLGQAWPGQDHLAIVLSSSLRLARGGSTEARVSRLNEFLPEELAQFLPSGVQLPYAAHHTQLNLHYREVALAPYQHLEEDMKSLKQVLEMKNQQIHQQEKKIIELEKLAEKNIILEEKIQVLQQQNEDLRARIDQNTVVTRQLSEENANLQEYAEKEAQEKKRLSRTNEELLWKLQTGDPTSPIKLTPTSPVYRGSSSGPSSPAKVVTTPR